MTVFAAQTSARQYPTVDKADRHDPGLLAGVCTFLSEPRHYREVESLEAELLVLWRDVLDGRNTDLEELEACSAFFSQLGFLHKYKVYGVKIALPFGYSLFDLTDGSGFSFQIHEQPKLEGFHVLRPKKHALLYVADLDEWERDGRDWAIHHFAGGTKNTRRLPTGGLVPKEGDVATVSQTNTVHTVLGCILEEYASCSVDSVTRLHDQNDRSDPVLPQAHPPSVALLRSGSTALPVRQLARSAHGWATQSPTQDGEILKTGQVRGWREVIRPGQARRLEPGPHVTSVVIVTCRLLAASAGSTTERRPGEVVVVPPGLAMTLTASIPTIVSVHQVPSELATYAWSR